MAKYYLRASKKKNSIVICAVFYIGIKVMINLL